MNLNLVFSKPINLNLNLVFSQLMNLNLEIQTKLNGSNQCRRYGGAKAGRTPLSAACAPFWFTKNTAFETSRNDKTTDNDGKRNNYV